ECFEGSHLNEEVLQMIRQTWKKMFVILSVTAVLALASGSSFAHHSAVGLWSPDTTATVTGTVKKFLYVNPHAAIVFDVKTAAGQHQEWRTLMGNVRQLTNIGWSKNTLKAGDEITIFGYPYTNGEKVIFSRFITLNGKKYEVHGAVENTNKTNPGQFPGREDFKVEDDVAPPKRK